MEKKSLQKDYTAGQIAALLVGDPADQAALERIKHWTRRGYILADVQSPGTGNHRRYGQSQIAIAKTLYELDELGVRLPVNRKVALLKAVAQSRKLRQSLADLLVALRQGFDHPNCKKPD
ncbi:DNA-binding transcriptional MerR regulator [Bradyrhizobium japonicum]|uniref:hypothetical protein n=1 Tax=Bradyrhizobium TaxID=374 RepID=UPI0004BB819F|nr:MULTISPECIES: hypothetical protein [Bradyrhizobium]MBR0947251.1 hypothetical protein [Bradyrhizobium liaoningense]MBR1005161.1 hypothetical protein [Bradyrhizobium liaoningense]MBR1034260.1 hypothetical protein [Bradyrhizobium liaoningense]